MVDNSDAAERAGSAPAAPQPPLALLDRPYIFVPLSAFALLYAGILLLSLAGRARSWDFSHYYVSALAMRQGVNPYATSLAPLASSLGLDIKEIDKATNPPTFILLFEPLTFLAPVSAYWAWTGLNIIALAGALYLLVGGLSLGSRLSISLVALVLLYEPTTQEFFYAQTQILILLLLALIIRWLQRGHDVAAGFALALAGLLKIFPLLLIGYLLAIRRWRAAVYTACGLLLGGFLTLALVGLIRGLAFFQVVGFVAGQHWLGTPANVALGATISRLFWYSAGAPMTLTLEPGHEFTLRPVLELLRHATVILAQLGMLAVTVRATLAESNGSADRHQRAFGLWVVTAVLLSPTAWVHYMVLLLIPFAQLIGAYARTSRRALRLGLGSYLLAEFVMIMLLVTSTFIPVWARCALINGWAVSLMLAYGSAYYLAVD